VAVQASFAHLGVSEEYRSDRALEATESKAMDELKRKYSVRTTSSAPYHQSQNRAELYVGKLKEAAIRIMKAEGAPPEVALFALLYAGYVMNRTANERCDWRTPVEKRTGAMPDVSSLRFRFYEEIEFMDYPKHEHKFPKEKMVKGRWLGPAPDIGTFLAGYVLKENGEVVIAEEIGKRSKGKIPVPDSLTTLRGPTDCVTTTVPGPPPKEPEGGLEDAEADNAGATHGEITGEAQASDAGDGERERATLQRRRARKSRMQSTDGGLMGTMGTTAVGRAELGGTERHKTGTIFHVDYIANASPRGQDQQGCRRTGGDHGGW
jgi:hypothetical protein